MSNRQGVTYDADTLVNLTPGSLTYNGATYDVTASGSAAAAQATASAALAAAAAAQATANAALPKAGGTMTGDINMSGTQKVTSMALPTAPGDATNKQYVDNLVAGVLRFKGSTDCSGNPNYPAAALGDAYVVSVAGKIGGAAGITVEAGDVYFAIAANAGGTQAAVGSSWDVVQYNLTGALLSANNLSDVANVATSRNNLGLGSVAILAADSDGTLAANSDLKVATQKATKTYADTKLALTGGSLTGALGINRGGGAINATDLHIGAGNITIDGSVSMRFEPVVSTPGNFPRTMTFHPKYTGATGVNAIAMQAVPEVDVGVSMPELYGMYCTWLGSCTKWIGLYISNVGGTATTKYDAIFNGGGNVGIGTIAPTALLHLKAGTATAGTAPLKFTSGTLMTTPENGAIEYDGSNIYQTSGGVRQTLALVSSTVAKSGDKMTGALGINRGAGTINATDLHIGAGSISIDGSVSTRLEPSTSTPGNYPRTLVFHPTYGGTTGVNAIALQCVPEVAGGASMPFLIGEYVGFLGTATKWVGLWVDNAGGTATTKYDALFTGGGNVGIGISAPTALLHVSGTTKLGTSGTALTQVVVYTPTLTPAAIAGAAYTEQTFTVTGLATTDTVTVNGPAAAANTVLVHARVSAANTLALTWITSAAATPTSGTYRIVAIRS